MSCGVVGVFKLRQSVTAGILQAARLLVAAFLLVLSSCGEEPRFEYIVHDIDGHRLKIPYAYIPDDIYYSKDHVTMDWVHLQAYLPDMRPWRSDVAKWKEPRDHDRVRIHIKKVDYDWGKVVTNQIDSANDHVGKYKDTKWENYGYSMARQKVPDANLLINPHGVNGVSLTICDYENRVPNPLCRAAFSLSPHLHVHFYFRQGRMDEWSEIERKVYELIRGFEQNTGEGF